MVRSSGLALIFLSAMVVSLRVQALLLVWWWEASQARKVVHFCGEFVGVLRKALRVCCWSL